MRTKTLVAAALLASLSAGAAARAADKPAPLPPVPEVLKAAKATLSDRKDVGPTLTLTSDAPLTPEHWDAVAKLGVRSFNLNGAVSDDAGMARLAAMDPVALSFGHSPMTDAGGMRFAEMKSLRVLRMSHTDKLTPASAAALAKHPALEVFANDGKFGIGGMAQIATAPKLRDVLLQHGVSSDANVALLAKHPALEVVRLWPSGTAAFTDAGVAPLATIPNLRELTIERSVLSYEGLRHLKGCPKLAKLTLNEIAVSDADLAKLKADLPNVTVTHKPMPPEYRAQWDGWAAKAKSAGK
ncbi:MAG TPA: hypothetical protein VF796_23120 [Humisphaera sp.]